MRRVEREKRTIGIMIRMYCRAHHGTAITVCSECQTLTDFALRRIEKCVFLPGKPTCANCPVHCYKPDMRKQIRIIMRWAGPRMPRQHPLLALMHIVDGLRRVEHPKLAKLREQSPISPSSREQSDRA